MVDTVTVVPGATAMRIGAAVAMVCGISMGARISGVRGIFATVVSHVLHARRRCCFLRCTGHVQEAAEIQEHEDPEHSDRHTTTEAEEHAKH